LIDQLLARADSSIDALSVTAIAEDIDKIERISFLANFADGKRPYGGAWGCAKSNNDHQRN
jgi:hypothetical protein